MLWSSFAKSVQSNAITRFGAVSDDKGKPRWSQCVESEAVVAKQPNSHEERSPLESPKGVDGSASTESGS